MNSRPLAPPSAAEAAEMPEGTPADAPEETPTRRVRAALLVSSTREGVLVFTWRPPLPSWCPYHHSPGPASRVFALSRSQTRRSRGSRSRADAARRPEYRLAHGRDADS